VYWWSGGFIDVKLDGAIVMSGISGSGSGER
jgi:hypothetical protein